MRVDFADNKSINMPGDDDEIDQSGPPKKRMDQMDIQQQQPPMNIPNNMQSAPQQQLPPQDPIMAALQQIPRAQLYDAVAQMKQIVLTDPDRARQMFSQTPMLALVMLNMQTMLGMMKPPALVQPPMVVAPPHVMQMEAPPQHMYNQPPPQQAVPQPVVQPPPVPPPAVVQPAAIQQIIRSLPPQKLQQIISMTPAQIEQLPAQEKHLFLLIQSQMRSLASDVLKMNQPR